jgi:hypothetical protein
MTISKLQSNPVTNQSTNRNSNQPQPQGPVDLFAVMKDGSILEMMPEDVHFLLGGNALPVAYRLVHLNGDTSDFRHSNLDLVRDDEGAANALQLVNLDLACDDAGAAMALQLSQVNEVAAFARQYLQKRD